VSSDRCNRCNRVLKNPDCIEAGFGRVCFQKMTGRSLPGKRAAAKETSTAKTRTGKPAMPKAVPLVFGDIVCARGQNGAPETNVPRRITRHSPDGFEWGYGGSGPADLALNILLMFVDEPVATSLHQEFKWDFITPLPEEGGIIKRETVLKWLEERGIVTT
jgi:hypothetical protein